MSSRDAASRFNSLLQGIKTVTELKKELERLSHQMVELPSGYDMARCFLNALKPEIAGAVVRRGINSENNSIEAIFETAKSIEQGMFYEERQRGGYRTTRYQDESTNKPSSKFKTTGKDAHKKGDDKTATKATKPFKPVGASDKNMLNLVISQLILGVHY